MAAHRKNLTLAGLTLVAIALAVMVYLSFGSPELDETVKHAASEAADRAAPVITWKVRMLRFIGWL
jgi:hypothetical protein